MSTLTRQRHAELGRSLKDIRDSLLLLLTALPYPTSGPVHRKAKRAIEAIDSLRCALDSQAAKDLGNEFDPRLYYPGQRG